MKTNRILMSILGIGLFILLITPSCSLKSDNDNAPTYLGLGVIKGNEQSFSIMLDNKVVLYPQTGIKSSVIKDGKRVLFEYSQDQKITENGQDNYKVTLYYLDSILTKKPIQLTHSRNDSLGNDMVNIKAIWSGSHYLNVDFQLKYGNSTKKHLVNLAIDTIQTSADTVNFIFKHNAYNDTYLQAKSGLVSFDMSNYIKDGKKLNLKLKYKNYANESRVLKLQMKADSVSVTSLDYYSRANFR